MGRLILGLDYGDERQEDHGLHDTLDNRRMVNGKENLRIASPLQNCQNRSRRSDNASGYKGVSKRLRKGCKIATYRAQIDANGANQHIGDFTTAIEAAQAYDARAVELFGRFAYLNFPSP
jgi:hypothetical protein